jgi:hypothetical protein
MSLDTGVTNEVPVDDGDGQRPVPGARRTWGPAHYLALVSIPLLTYQVWTWVSWLADGPYQVTADRSDGSFSWYAARTIEIVLTLVVIVLVAMLVRQCRAQRRLTFDAMLFIGLVLTVFWDTVVNFVEPLWFYSTNLVNVNDWWGHAPFMINAAAGHSPNPVFVLTMMYALGTLEAMMICQVMDRAARRWPGISKARLIAVAFVSASLIGTALSLTMTLTHLWGDPGMPIAILGGEYHYSLLQFLYIGAWSATLASLRFFVNKRGERVTERGLEGLPARSRTVVALLATIAACNLSVIVWSAPITLMGIKTGEYPADYPPSLSNVYCDTPGRTGTAYGPCPGSPGFTIPIR